MCLKRQVKALLQEKSVLKEQAHVARALELHVVSALQAHEQQLALQHAKRRDEVKNDQPENVATVRLECTLPDDDTEDSAEKVVHEEHFGIDSKPDEKSAERTRIGGCGKVCRCCRGKDRDEARSKAYKASSCQAKVVLCRPGVE